jgi:hypothetical protein
LAPSFLARSEATRTPGKNLTPIKLIFEIVCASEMDVEDELRRLEDEFGFGVKHIATSRWHDSHGVAGEKAYVAVTTLEGAHLCVLLSVRGFQVRCYHHVLLSTL